MSTERPDNDVTEPRRRRSPLAVASVAAAVLLAGGGAYLVAAEASEGKSTPSSDAAGAAPPTLALDGPDTGPATPGPRPSAPPEGIAPGEPDPNGGRVVYRASGTLPKGPDRAAVQRPAGAVTSAEVSRLAKALGVSGTPRAQGTSWTVGATKDGAGPVLRVAKEAPGTWTFARYGTGGTDNCQSVEVCSDKPVAPGDGSGAPVSEREARAAAAPVLKAVGQEGATLDARQVMGSVRVVNADPVVGGLPTYGWATGVQVGPDGEVTGGSGQLKGLEKGAEYPVVGADEALKELNAAQPKSGGNIGGCIDPPPAKEGEAAPHYRCGKTTGAEPPPRTVTVEKAVFGLAAQYVDGKQILVPSWLFTTRAEAGGRGETVTQVAVDPAFLKKDAPATQEPGDSTGTPSGPVILSYATDGRTLSVTFWGGACSTYTASADEDGATVRVTVTEKKGDPGRACIMVAKQLTRSVTLDRPLGDRTVMDTSSGHRVPRA
ncbi:hypothetical protein ACWC1D_14435 [Streptomyces sp. NPDC001478]